MVSTVDEMISIWLSAWTSVTLFSTMYGRKTKGTNSLYSEDYKNEAGFILRSAVKEDNIGLLFTPLRRKKRLSYNYDASRQ